MSGKVTGCALAKSDLTHCNEFLKKQNKKISNIQIKTAK